MEEKLTIELLIIICVFLCVVITVIWLIIQCLSSIWSSLFSEQDIVFTPAQNIYKRQHNPNIHTYIKKRVREVIAIDTESVGGPRGESMLARVSLVARSGVVYDRYVKPSLPVMDYRTRYSGIREEDLDNAVDFFNVRFEVSMFLDGCILVGHDLKHDLNSLKLSHPAEDIRDTSECKLFRKMVQDEIVEQEMRRYWTIASHYDAFYITLCRVQAMKKAEKLTNPKPKLSLLAYCLLDRDIQTGEHSSIEDAQAAMDLYLRVEGKWETAVASGKLY